LPQLEPIEVPPVPPHPQLQPAEAQPEPQPHSLPVEAQPAASPPPQLPVAGGLPDTQHDKQAAPIESASPDAAEQVSAVNDPAPQADAAANSTGPPPTAPDQADNASHPQPAVEETAVADLLPDISEALVVDPTAAARSYVASLSFLDGNSAARSAHIYFGGGALGSLRGLEQWAPGAEPVLVMPALADPDIKLSALTPDAPGKDGVGETVVPKGEDHSQVNRPKSPAERLNLTGATRAKAEKCLADAVYFESRGEPLRGQMAVAQVVVNRVFSGFYPNSVCGVVYQNAHRRLACQFTFACDGIRDRVTEPNMWEQAKRISRDTLDGKIWLPEVGHATHYHAYWVRPSWVHEMKKMHKLGVHTFYRPRAWGSGTDEPAWGPVPADGKSGGVNAQPNGSGAKPEADGQKDAPTAKL
jgi:spore germination cell wall hydrolase CwlJ-like protein